MKSQHRESWPRQILGFWGEVELFKYFNFFFSGALTSLSEAKLDAFFGGGRKVERKNWDKLK